MVKLLSHHHCVIHVEIRMMVVTWNWFPAQSLWQLCMRGTAGNSCFLLSCLLYFIYSADHQLVAFPVAVAMDDLPFTFTMISCRNIMMFVKLKH